MVQSFSFVAPPSEELLRAERSSMDYKLNAIENVVIAHRAA